jgi:hypothetical protein
MRVYLASPSNQMQTAMLNGMPVLMSYASYYPWLDQWLPSFDSLLIDSGAFSEMNTGKKIDLNAYADWASSIEWADAWAGLDDINGDWERSLRNYEAGGFPTFHDTDPPELLDELIPISLDRGKWLGIGLKPPRGGKEEWLKETLSRIPREIHVHGFALRAYTHLPRLDSVDSTNWLLDSMKLRRDIPWLTLAEAVQLIVKRYKRWTRTMPEKEESTQLNLLSGGR